MGWHYILHLRCILLPEYVDFMKARRLSYFSEDHSDEGKQTEQERDYNLLEKRFQDLVDIWRTLDIDSFYEYSVKDTMFSCEISHKVNTYHGDLQKAYETFLKGVMVPMTSEILECEIESDDYGDARYVYSDAQLRNVMFSLQDVVKYVEHTYNEDRSEILESRVVYKRSIPRRLFLDLDRAYRRF